MASPGDLIREMALALNVPEATIVVHDRNLLEAGLRTKGGRGRSAARITARDAAHLLVAILGSAQTKDSVHSVKRYGRTRIVIDDATAQKSREFRLDAFARLKRDHSFLDAVEALLIAASRGSLAAAAKQRHSSSSETWPMIEIAAMTPGTVGDLRIAGISRTPYNARYMPPEAIIETSPANNDPAALKRWAKSVRNHRIESDLEQYRRVSDKTIRRLANLLADEKET